MTFVAVLDPDVARHAATALAGYRATLAARGLTVPAGFDVLAQAIGKAARTVADPLDGLPPTVTLDRAADVLGLSVRTVQRRIRAGELAAVKDGRRLLVERSALADYLAGRRDTTGSRQDTPDAGPDRADDAGSEQPTRRNAA
jgi:excisionase family DNA binding protein